MLSGFLCPDGEQVKTEDCLGQCRMGRRCLTLPTLVSVAQERRWSGSPSTTQCLNGTRYEYLKITKPYYISPEDRAFALLGNQHHERLEAAAENLNTLAEEKLGGGVTGILDCLECDPEEQGLYVLSDYKSAGSFKVARALGVVKSGKKPDPSGAVYKVSGWWGKAGTSKMVDNIITDPAQAEAWEWWYQLNHYRRLIEASGFHISRMQIQATVRDGGLRSAKEHGLYKNIYMIPVPVLPYTEIEPYFAMKAEALREAVESDTMPPPCTDAERWDGRRCKGYCEVWNYCDVGIKEHGL